MEAEFTPHFERLLLEAQTSKHMFRSRAVKFCNMTRKATANCDRMSRELAEHKNVAMHTAVENTDLKRKLEDSQNYLWNLKQQKAGCSILPGPTAPKLCVFKF